MLGHDLFLSGGTSGSAGPDLISWLVMLDDAAVVEELISFFKDERFLFLGNALQSLDQFISPAVVVSPEVWL